ncbi:MAG: hypothetical protein SCK57_12175, partial [Bacillota bacterium]|nr:hypothetical protein [Bacillota bacterium]
MFPDERAIEGLKAFDEVLPESPGDPKEIIELLHTYGSPASVAQTGDQDDVVRAGVNQAVAEA